MLIMLGRNEVVIAHKVLSLNRVGVKPGVKSLSELTGLTPFITRKSLQALEDLKLLVRETKPHRPNAVKFTYQVPEDKTEFIEVLYNGQF